ncbi:MULTISPECIES: ComF family protein [Paraburkholderia]|uniref:ComF family protein n=1 Tax=Paraburkholderia madseniana TaxID=2599607 RepID=A0A6N6W7L2_9BURK|nr:MULTISPECIES: ComF family protein [Paraburkholderia]KAE8756677.1 ComF family protein [Paraburkholderia madseniana]MCX4171433.1 ComF family protein [Paraburkholderia madseniana]MDQ6459444.1 ComF family protein [Paraburkholderia madseniana]
MPLRKNSSSPGGSNALFARFTRGLYSAWPHVMHAALPNLCALCGNLSHKTLCAGCDEAYWNEARLRCTVCAVPLSGARWASHARYRCADCIGEPPPFEATFALADYRQPLDALALGLKFRARLMLAREFAQRLARLAGDSWVDAAEKPDVLAPVPLANKRLTERGYNQAWQIARPLARALNVRSDATLLHRVIHTAPQSRLDLDARRLNVGRAFKVVKPVQGLHVGIVDDVMTTGATLEALARTLKAAGARRVTNFVALRTPKN